MDKKLKGNSVARLSALHTVSLRGILSKFNENILKGFRRYGADMY